MSVAATDYATPSLRRRRTVADALTYVVLVALAIVTLVPFAYLVCSSVKQQEHFFDSLFLPFGGPGGVRWGELTLGHFRRLLTEMDFLGAFLNSLFLASVISVLSTLCSAMGGFALAKYRFKGRGMATFAILTALVVPGALLLAPAYELLFKLRLLDSYAGLILPAAAPAFGVYLFRQAMISSLPDELLEAGRIDGAGEFRMFFTVALPLVRPMVGAFLLITFLATWNNFIGPQIVLQSPERFPLSVAIAQLKGVYGTDYGLLMAGTLVSILPVLALFLLLQREFISGLTAGAVKG